MKIIQNHSQIDQAMKWFDLNATKILNAGKKVFLDAGVYDENSLEMNSKYHAMIGDIAKQAVFKTPAITVKMSEFDAKEAKALLVTWFERECSQNNEHLRHGSRVVIDPFTSEKITIRASTKDFLKTEQNKFIEWLYATGADGGVRWSEPALKEYESYQQSQV